MALNISEISIYPVKSLAGVRLDQAEVVQTGFRYDRNWMIVDEDGIFVTQRQFPALALIRTAVTRNGVRLTLPNADSLEIRAVDDGPAVPVEIWEQPCDAVDQGIDAASFLSSYLGRNCRLVRMHPGFRRRIKAKYYQGESVSLGFPDSMPFLLAGEASLADLNERLASPVSMNRFRPNLVVSGSTAFQEDSWKRIRIGEVTLRVVKSCIRCEMTTIDQGSGEKGIEPLETLGTYRTGSKGVLFGRHLLHESTGTIHVGDAVEVLE